MEKILEQDHDGRARLENVARRLRPTDDDLPEQDKRRRTDPGEEAVGEGTRCPGGPTETSPDPAGIPQVESNTSYGGSSGFLTSFLMKTNFAEVRAVGTLGLMFSAPCALVDVGLRLSIFSRS